MAKKRPVLTADQLRTFKANLFSHSVALQAKILKAAQNEGRALTFHDAADLRDSAQHLTSTLCTLGDIDMFIELAEREGPRTVFFDLQDCGIDQSIEEFCK